MKHLLIIALVLELSSCRTINKSLSRNKEKVSTDTEVTVAATQTATGAQSVTASRTITEQIDSNQVVQGSILAAEGNIEQLDTGGVITAESGDQVIVIHENKRTGQITAISTVKNRKIPVTGKRTIIENVATVTNTTALSAVNTQSHSEIKSSSDNKLKESEKTPGTNWFFIGVVTTIIVLLIILVILWYLRRQGKILL